MEVLQTIGIFSVLAFQGFHFWKSKKNHEKTLQEIEKRELKLVQKPKIVVHLPLASPEALNDNPYGRGSS